MKNSSFLATLLVLVSLMGAGALDAHARAGGGGGGGGDGGDPSMEEIAITLTLIAIAEVRRRKLKAKARKDILKAQITDPSWHSSELEAVARKCFYAYQKAWCEKNLEEVRHLLHSDYFQEAEQTLQTTLQGERNIMEGLHLGSVEIIAIRDVPGHDGDMFVAEINASARDYVVDARTGAFKRGDRSKESSFREYWAFVRCKGQWLLFKIDQGDVIVRDLIGMSLSELRAVLNREKKSAHVDDSVFFKDRQPSEKKKAG
jgi:hypothetical protein